MASSMSLSRRSTDEHQTEQLAQLAEETQPRKRAARLSATRLLA